MAAAARIGLIFAVFVLASVGWLILAGVTAHRSSEQGSVLNIVLAAPEGQRLDTPARKAAIQKTMAELRSSSEFKPTTDTAGLTSVGNPFSDATFSDSGRIAYAEAQFDRVI